MISMEYVHIYSDESIGQEQIDSLLAAKSVMKGRESEFIKTVLIDEYHPEAKNLIMVDLLDWLEREGMLPHYVYLEGDLRKDAYRLLYSIPKDIRRSICHWMADKEKFPCSLLSATWYLLRLGAMTPFQPIYIQPTLVPIATELLNVLPEKYKKNEERALELIRASTIYSGWEKYVHYEWFNG